MDRHLQRDLENLKNQEENFKQLTERAQQLTTQVLSAALLSQKNGQVPFSCTCILPAAFVVTATVAWSNYMSPILSKFLVSLMLKYLFPEA